MTARRVLMIILSVVGLLLAAAGYVWRGDIIQTFLDPGSPFLTYKPPPAPDYDAAAAWAALPAATAEGEADVFFVHPTTYDGGREWNAPIDNTKANRLLSGVMLPNYAGPYQRLGRVFAPRYRQASLYAHLTSREDAAEARTFAYGDVVRAFDAYRARRAGTGPLIIVGVEQGGFLAERLVRDVIAPEPALRARLAAVYLIDNASLDGAAGIPACSRRDEAGCVVAYLSAVQGEPDTVEERLRHSLVWTGQSAQPFGNRRPVCVNPLTGVRNGLSEERDHLGGVDASKLESDVRPAFLAHEVATRCANGVLQVTQPRSASLRLGRAWLSTARARPFNLFYADLEADALARIAAWKSAGVADRPVLPPVE